MYKYAQKIFLFIFSMIALNAASRAATTEFNFASYNLQPLFFTDRPSPPVTSIMGSFTLEDNTLISIDLKIGEHIYSIDELEFIASPFDQFVLGGRLNGINGINVGTDDFQLFGGLHNSWPLTFLFSSSTEQQIYKSHQNTITFSPSTVPIPSTALLFGSAILGLMGAIRKRF